MYLNYFKHLLHTISLCTFIILLELKSLTIQANRVNSHRFDQYLTLVTTILQALQYLIAFPQLLFNFLGLTLFNVFPGKIDRIDQRNQQTDSPAAKATELPHLCLRVVTRGLYPDLVQRNVSKNYLTCIESGLINFSIEVVTDKEISLNNVDETRVRQLVVPSSYKTATGALFKARALQYALEPENSPICEGNYIVHLDEETLVTENSINGIINFTLDGRYDFGQGLITYTNQEIVNWLTTLSDSYRVSDDMGKLRFQFYAFHKPLFGWKGSYVVTKYEAEKDVSFDHGPDGSIAEDCYFSMIAFKKGYTFNFIQGEMWEKSPFTVPDLIRQRKRWIQGIWLTVHSSKIPIANKFLLAMSLYAWATVPITTLNFIVTIFYPVPTPIWISLIGSFSFAITFYMYIFGLLKSFDLKTVGIFKLLIYLISQVFAIFLELISENIAVILGLFSPTHHFYIVEKDVNRKVVAPDEVVDLVGS